MKNSQRLIEATAYADKAFATALGCSPNMVGFAMLGLDLRDVRKEDGTPLLTGDEDYRKTQLWEFVPVDPAKVAPFLAAERADSVAALAAKYASDPMGTGDSPYEHEFHPFELCAGIVDNCRNNALEIPEFITKLATSLLTK